MKSSLSLTSLVSGLGLVLTAGLAAAQDGPFELPDDHFLCYKGKADKKLGQVIPKGTPVTLADQFQTGDYGIKKLRGICNPADAGGAGIVDPNTHLTPWQIKTTGAKHVAQNITTFDQFGRLSLTTIKEDRMLAPAGKSLTMAPPWVSAPSNGSHSVDHYQCYKAKISKGTEKFPKGIQATLDDQFPESTRNFDLKKPKLFCNPVNTNGQGIKNTDGHLVCYQAKPTKGEPKHTKLAGIEAADEFVAESAVATTKEELLCVPALKNPPAEFCGDGEVNQSEACDGDAATCPGLADVCLPDCTCVPTAKRCGNGILEPGAGEECEADTDCSSGEACTTSCACMDSQCPDTLIWTRFASEGVMSTGTDHDSGWTGVAHDNTEPDEGRLHFRLGNVSGSGPASCGTATIIGIDPASRLCRCRNDNRQVCDQPRELDLDDCGGAECVCFLENPNPSVSGNVPTCSLTEFAGPVTGTWNVDTGEGEVSLNVEQTTSLSDALLDPCATCVGDVTLNDGVRDGTCNGGVNNGQSCDAQSNDATFPAPGGGSYSLDCFPSGPVVVNGLFSPISFTTGSRSLDAVLPCGLGDADLCHCGRCDQDNSVPCRADGDCAAVGGSCGPVSVSEPLGNACSDGACSSLGDGNGECLADPENYCDGLVRATGLGLVGCITNADCEPTALGLDAGDCLLVQNKSCVPDSVTLTGNPDPASPIVVSAECIAPSLNNPAANIVAGYPGPGLRTMEVGAELRCAGNPGATYPSCP